jgi:hypothetical protein
LVSVHVEGRWYYCQGEEDMMMGFVSQVWKERKLAFVTLKRGKWSS